jgi:hypothetical protein
MSTPTRFPNGLSVDDKGPMYNLTIPNPDKIALWNSDFFEYSVNDWSETRGGVGSVASLTPVTVGALTGTAAGFVILAGSAITNTGNTVITGNIGEYPGTAVTGFPPGTVSGTQQITNNVARQALLDANAAFINFNTVTGTTIASALDGQTLTAGTYNFASGAATLATSAPGTLTLNGSATDVFVIKTATTLTTGAGGAPTITLTGGALAKNVYWIVGTSATINSGTAGTFVGNIIAQASVTDTMGGTINGSLTALSGAVTIGAAATINNVATTNVTAAPGPDGWLVLIAASGTEAIQLNPPAFNFRPATSLLQGLQTWFTARIKTDATVANPDYMVGLTNGALTTLNSATDGVYFTKATGATVWSLVIKAAAGGTTTIALPAVTLPVGSTIIELSYYFDGTRNVLYVYFNRLLIGTVADGTYPSIGFGSLGITLANLPGPTVLLAPTMLNAYHTATSNLFVDYLLAGVDRTM